MARKQASALSNNSFAECIFKISQRFSLHSVFEDFLTMSIAACTQNISTGLSWYEDEYMATIDKYKTSELRHEFPNAFAALIVEMELRGTSSSGNDILGEFFEQHLSSGRNGQFFTPYPICQFMASCVNTDTSTDEQKKPLRVLDPACGSGRMLIAAHRNNGALHEYFGIDIDMTCVKMAALNLFLNGIWNSEVMCANALAPDDFVLSYHISFFPFGIFKIEDKEKSRLWHLHQNSFIKKSTPPHGETIILDTTPFAERKKDDGIQLDLF